MPATYPDQILPSARGYRVDDRDHGGAPANGSDDTAAFQAVWADCIADQVPLVVPPGVWRLDDTLNPGAWGHPAIHGAGYDATTLLVGAGVRAVTADQKQRGCVFRDFTVQGGEGFYHYTYALGSVAEYYVFHGVRFYDYTGCAIANESVDNPHLWVTSCEFRAHDFLETIGVAWCGQADAMHIVNNLFQVNRVGLKLSHRPDDASLRGPKNGMIAGNGFIRLARGAAGPSTHDVWIVPGATSTGGTTGALAFHGNKFGSENLRDATTNGVDGIANSDGQSDRWLLIADEDAIGSDNATRFPVFTPSVGGVSGIDLDESNSFNTNVPNIPNGIIYSTTPWVSGVKISGYLRGSAVPAYALELSSDPAAATSAAALAASQFNQSNIFGPFRTLHGGVDFAGIRGSNYPGMGVLVDPLGQWAGRGGFSAQPGGQNPGGYTDLLTTRVNAYSLTGGSTLLAVTDSQGGGDAAEVTFGAGGSVRSILTAFTPGRPVYIDFDVEAGQTGTPLSTVNFIVFVPGAGGAVAFHRQGVTMPSGWESRRFWFTPRDAGPYTIQFISSAAGTARVGRIQAYHAGEPVSHGPLLLRSPNGTIYHVSVDDTGALVVT